MSVVKPDPTSATQSKRLVPTALLFSAGIMGGLEDLIDFLLPLWAGIALELSPSVIGIILAVELAVAFALRPVAGRAVDRGAGPLLAAGGATLYAGGIMLMTFAHGLDAFLFSAILLGAGSAFFWVPLRAHVATQREAHSSFSALTSAEGTGVWVAYVLALSLLPVLDYRGVLALGAAAAAVAALSILRASGRRRIRSDSSTPRVHASGDAGPDSGLAAQRRRLSAVVVLVSFVEAAASIYLLLRLQNAFGLDIMQIVWVYVPGLIAYSIAPFTGQSVIRVLGERTVVVVALLLSAGGILLLTLDAREIALAAGWAMMCWSWGWLNPVQQATAVRIYPGTVGRAVGRYESWTLIGGAAGAVCGGFALDSNSPGWVAGAAVTICLVCVAVVPGLYYRRVGSKHAPESPGGSRGTAEEKIMLSDQLDRDGHQVTAPDDDPSPVASQVSTKDERRSPASVALIHATIYGLVQIPLIAADLSWYRDMFTAGRFVWGRESHADLLSNALYTGNMVWGAFVLWDLAWAVVRRVAMARDGRRGPL
ncbi:MFS transporter [Clavibacter sp. VKM Ac-2872]|uniref:MFS transporter n=1 Tax=Clavibacter sp. VKM Ac-2872 TaxID=2783812 RepID=UPI00188A06A2|nr:MFS transporter [Clavibacter sp. VKM Ac-2872]MBF4623229.1 MFS transporter [Clavibacter sp. VKM Ac-2872]